MIEQSERAADSPEQPPPAGYEAPRVERVLMSGELEREVLYAGDRSVET